MSTETDPLLVSSGGDGGGPPPTMRPSEIKRRKERLSMAATAHETAAEVLGPNKRDVEYDGDNHLSVLLQMYGSVWPAVLPWCIAVCVFTGAVYALKMFAVVDLTIKSQTGHNFMSILVSFLIVTRTTIAYGRFMEARQHLADLYRSIREVVQFSCLLSLMDDGVKAKKWRTDVAYRSIVSLRMAVAAIQFRSHGVQAWEDLPEEDQRVTELYAVTPASATTTTAPAPTATGNKSSTGGGGGGVNTAANTTEKATTAATSGSSTSPGGDGAAAAGGGGSVVVADPYSPTAAPAAGTLSELQHGPRTPMDENLRAPLVWAFNLREKILDTRVDKTVLVQYPLHVNEHMKLLQTVGDFVAAYHGLTKLIMTPFPFPLVQMCRTFLFFWIFSLPLVLLKQGERVGQVLFQVFFITYGFLGLEYVSMELDDPYGNDPNDFPAKRWAETVYEDIYICLYKRDGYDAAAELRGRITSRFARGSALENYQDEGVDEPMSLRDFDFGSSSNNTKTKNNKPFWG